MDIVKPIRLIEDYFFYIFGVKIIQDEQNCVVVNFALEYDSRDFSNFCRLHFTNTTV